MWLPRGSSLCAVQAYPWEGCLKLNCAREADVSNWTLGPYAAQVKAATLALAAMNKTFRAAAALCLCAVAANASTIGPNDLDDQRLCKRSINCRWKVALTNGAFQLDGTHIHFHRAALISRAPAVSAETVLRTLFAPKPSGISP